MSDDLLAALMAGAARAAQERARVHRREVEQAATGWTPRGALFCEGLVRPGVQIIAECKRRSPSRGVLREDYDPVVIARGYAAAGAAALSILTEPTFFDGSLEHLASVRGAVDLPLLRKDFISDEYQLVEARAAGADAILLIVAGLDDRRLARLIGRAESNGFAALVEVHSREELRRAIGAGATLIGVNSRNLKTLAVDLRLHDELVLGIPAGTTAIAESGLTTGADLRRLRQAGYDGFLIGERFMTVPDPGAALATLLRDASVGEAAT